jgi:diacylglycerol kinase family enzyme
VGVGAFADMVLDDDEGGPPAHTAVVLACVRKALIEKLLAAPPLELEIDIDGEEIEGEYLLSEVLNLRFVGPRLLCAPDPRSDRDVLTVCAVEASQRDVAAHWIAVGTGDARRFELGRGRVVRVRSDEPMHVDGKDVEEAGAGEIVLKAGARAARLWV